MAKKNINFKLPDRFELGLFMLAGLFLIIFDYSQNMFQFHKDLNYITLFGITAINLFWITFVAYHATVFTAFFRALSKKGTHYIYDWVFGSLIFVGMFALLVGGIGAMYVSPREPLVFFFNIAQIDLYHFGGVLLQLIGLGWFVVTE